MSYLENNKVSKLICTWCSTILISKWKMELPTGLLQRRGFCGLFDRRGIANTEYYPSHKVCTVSDIFNLDIPTKSYMAIPSASPAPSPSPSPAISYKMDERTWWFTIVAWQITGRNGRMEIEGKMEIWPRKALWLWTLINRSYISKKSLLHEWLNNPASCFTL